MTTGTASAQTKTVDLRVLVISGGNQETPVNGTCVSYADPNLELIKQVLDQMVVPYDVYDANANNLLRKGAVIGSPLRSLPPCSQASTPESITASS